MRLWSLHPKYLDRQGEGQRTQGSRQDVRQVQLSSL